MAGYLLTLWAMSVNAYFSQTVRIQTERGHTVVTDGPYAEVRHPGYVGMLCCMLGACPLLGSLYALIPWLLYLVLTVTRTHLEDRTLRSELHGYSDYAERNPLSTGSGDLVAPTQARVDAAPRLRPVVEPSRTSRVCRRQQTGAQWDCLLEGTA